MTGRSEPTRKELFKNFIDRVSTIPPSALQKRYNREGLGKILEYLGPNSDEASDVLSGVKPAEHTALPSGTGKSGHSHANVTSKPTGPASIGLTIESVVYYLVYISSNGDLEGRTLDVRILSLVKLRDAEYLHRHGRSYDWHTTPCFSSSHRYRICRSLGRCRRLPGCGRELRESSKGEKTIQPLTSGFL